MEPPQISFHELLGFVIVFGIVVAYFVEGLY